MDSEQESQLYQILLDIDSGILDTMQDLINKIELELSSSIKEISLLELLETIGDASD